MSTKHFLNIFILQVHVIVTVVLNNWDSSYVGLHWKCFIGRGQPFFEEMVTSVPGFDQGPCRYGSRRYLQSAIRKDSDLAHVATTPPCQLRTTILSKEKNNAYPSLGPFGAHQAKMRASLSSSYANVDIRRQRWVKTNEESSYWKCKQTV